jgi:hypothetical protein
MHRLLYPLAVFLLAGSLFGADPFVGTWKLNVAKSKFGGTNRPEKEETIVIQEQGDQRVAMQKELAGDGTSASFKYTVLTTGGELKYSEGGPKAGTSVVLAKRKADARTSDFTRSQNGKVIRTNHSVVSKDGKTMQAKTINTDAQGYSVVDVRVYERM